MMRNMIRNLFLGLVLMASMQSCIAYRFVKYGTEGIDDFKTFPIDTIHAAESPFRFAVAESSVLDTLRLKVARCEEPLTLRQMIDTLDSKHPSAGIVVVRNDTILFEHYRGMVAPDQHTTVFSVTKSVTSLLVGIALDKGYIGTVEDPVTKYWPELSDKAPEFARLTIEDLLDMRTGLAFSENYASNPFSGMARLHYGRNIQRQITQQKFKKEPGTEFEYNSMATAILGAVLERATGRRYAELLEEWVWQPIGMERYALMNLDDKEHCFAKAYGGLSSIPRDMARFGRLYLHGGEWEGERIVSKEWVDRSFSQECASANGWYTNSWRTVPGRIKYDDRHEFRTEELAEVMLAAHQREGYPIDKMRATQGENGLWTLRVPTECFFAYGLHGQVVFVDPVKRVVAVYLGNDRLDYFPTLFYRMSRFL
ncbi:MAG: serine hydrolase [Alistipes sp.]|nr:serine hydrolase [Alistipes sp.]